LYEIEEIEPLFQSLAVKFHGVDSPETAHVLSGAEIIVSRGEAAPLGASEFYVEDLRMLDVVYAENKVGHIIDVMEGGGGDLIEIQLLSGETKLVPFRDEFFGDVKTGSIVLLNDWILE
jgi:16S rRNA processing protein RimM